MILMSEWEVVGVLVVLIGLITAICKPVIQLTRAITKLTDAVGELERRLDRENSENRITHERLYQRDMEHAKKLNELERKVEMYLVDKKK